MEISMTRVGAVAALCVAVGAGGAYLVSGGGGRTAVVPEIATPVTVSEAQTPPANEPMASVARAAEPAARPPAGASAPTARASASTSGSRAVRQPQTRAASAVPEAVASAPAPTNEAPSPEAQVASRPEPVSLPEPEPIAEAEPPAQEFEELVVSADSVIGLQIETSTTSERAELEDEVIARVTRDVRVDGKVAIPAGAKAHGEVTLVERGGRLRERARLGVRFSSVVLADGTRVPLESETVYREGNAPGREGAAKIGGGAIGGAILGGLLGGAKGAAIGGSLGAGAGSAAVLAGGRNAATLPIGTPVTVRLTEAAIVTIDKQ